MNILGTILNFILRFIVTPILLVGYLFWKFFQDIMRTLYGKIVTVIATAILIYLISLFLKR